MFTRIAKRILEILMIIVLLLAVIITSETDGGFLVFVACVLLGGVGLFFGGIFVELANNIMDIKEILIKTYKTKDDCVDLVESLHKSHIRTKAQIIIGDKWICNECGTKNELDTSWCMFCGKQTRKKES